MSSTFSPGRKLGRFGNQLDADASQTPCDKARLFCCFPAFLIASSLGMLRNLIFDWSGTLVDDLGPVADAASLIFPHFGKPELLLEEFRGRFRLPFGRRGDRLRIHQSWHQSRLTQPPLHTFALRGRAPQIEWLRSGTDVFPAPRIPFSAPESMFAVRYWDIPATIKTDISITQIVRQKTMTFGYGESDRLREA